ncbi:MAG: hypothetical protein U5L06_04460 [Rhodovibrio sp.]|nr:hypothetical protein [Rhodovibrio sp.]
MLLAQFRQGHVAADLEIEVEVHAAVVEQPGAAFDDVLLQLEVRDAVDHQTADPVVAVVDVHLVALAAQLLGRRQTAGPGADDADRLAALAHRLDRLDPALIPGGFGDVGLDRADRDRAVASLLDHAVALAQAVLRADPAAHLGHVVGGAGDLVRLLQPALGGQHQPVGDVVVQRAVHLTVRHAALRTAAGLGLRLFRLEVLVDLVEVAPPGVRVPLLGHLLGDVHELERLSRHVGVEPPEKRSQPVERRTIAPGRTAGGRRCDGAPSRRPGGRPVSGNSCVAAACARALIPWARRPFCR